jgi:hypothetical protein
VKGRGVAFLTRPPRAANAALSRWATLRILNDARTKHGKRRVSARLGWAGEKSGFFSFLLQHEEEVKVIHVRAGGTGDDELLERLQCRVGVVALQRALEIH